MFNLNNNLLECPDEPGTSNALTNMSVQVMKNNADEFFVINLATCSPFSPICIKAAFYDVEAETYFSEVKHFIQLTFSEVQVQDARGNRSQ